MEENSTQLAIYAFKNLVIRLSSLDSDVWRRSIHSMKWQHRIQLKIVDYDVFTSDQRAIPCNFVGQTCIIYAPPLINNQLIYKL